MKLASNSHQAAKEYREIASRTQSECVRAVAIALQARATDGDRSSRIECSKALRRGTREYDGSPLTWRYLGECLLMEGNSMKRLTLLRRMQIEIRTMWNKTLLVETFRGHELEQKVDSTEREPKRSTWR